jgi:hypothetical protein
MNLHRTLAITRRLLAQFRHDRRTLAILFVTPLLMLGLFALLLRTDAAAPRVGVIASGDGLGALVGRALSESDALAAVSYASTSEADAALRVGDLDAYVVVPAAPDAGGVLRPQIVVEGTDARVASAVPLAMQRAVAAAVASFAPPLPPGAGEQLHRGRLAAPVRAEQTGDRAALGGEGEPVDDHPGAEAARETDDLEPVHAVHEVIRSHAARFGAPRTLSAAWPRSS